MNKAKTTLVFSKSVSAATKNSIKLLIEVPEIKEYDKYLGLPAIVGKNKMASLNYIKDRVWSKGNGKKNCYHKRVRKSY